MKDSLNCAKKNLCLIFTIMATKKWKIHSVDIKAAFVHGGSRSGGYSVGIENMYLWSWRCPKIMVFEYQRAAYTA